MDEVWVEIVMLAHNLLVWTQTLCLDGELANAQPKRVRHRLLHVAGRLAFSGRRGKLHLPTAWPWAAALTAAFQTLGRRRERVTPTAAGHRHSSSTPSTAPRGRDHRCPQTARDRAALPRKRRAGPQPPPTPVTDRRSATNPTHATTPTRLPHDRG